MVQFSYIDEAYSYKDNEKPQKKPKKTIQQPEPIVYNPPVDKSVREETEKAIKTSLNPPTYKNNYKYENDEFDTYLNLGFYSNKQQEPKINKSLNELREMFNNNNKSKNEKEKGKESENENTTTTNIKIDVNMFNLFLFIFLGIIIIILIEQITKLAIIKAT
jgi:hypothetical protein